MLKVFKNNFVVSVVNTVVSRKYILFIIALFIILSQLLLSGILESRISEGWFSDIAYNLNSNFNGKMAKDIPYGASWSSGIGKTFFLIHHVFYKLFGLGIFHARMISFISGLMLLFIVFLWTKKYISREVALLTTFLFALSPLLNMNLSHARQDLIHCFLAFCSFYLISTAILSGKRIFFFLAGIVSALSVDICYRGIEIVLATYALHLFYFDKKTFLKHSLLLLAGSMISFFYWLYLNVLLIGFDNYIKYDITFALQDGGPFSVRMFLSEVMRFLKRPENKILWFEKAYLIIISVVSYKYLSRYKNITKMLFLWLVINFLVLSVVEKASYAVYLLMYYPVLYIFLGIGFVEMFKENRRFAHAIFAAIVIVNFVVVGSYSSGYYIYHKFILKDCDMKSYYEKLRSSVDLNKNIIGTVRHWYAFPDAQYYGGHFYIARLISVLKELKCAKEYDSSEESARALLKVFKKRKIEYVIACEYFKPELVVYFPDKKLPSKNFKLINTIYDRFYGRHGPTKKNIYVTEIYKIISYDM